MHHYRKLSDASDASDDSESSNKSIEQPPLFRNLILELKRSIEELKSEFDRNHQTLDDQIKELDDAADELESMHRNSTVGSLVGSSVGAAGGIMSIAGLCLAPFTLGASLALTVGGAVAGVAGGVTGGASNITNMVKQKTLRENIEKIINELQTTIKPMEELLRKIDKITEALKNLAIQRAARGTDLQNIEKIINDLHNTIKPMVELLCKIYNITEELDKLDIQRAARATDLLKIVKVADLAETGKMFASAAKAARVTASAAKSIRTAAAVSGVFSAVFLALDVHSIVQDSKEISEMNQPAGKRKEEKISSETLKFILQMKKAAAQFKKIVETIKDDIIKINIFI
ncbi:hypothetical protein PO909_024863 [Leuciscus waleckii]